MKTYEEKARSALKRIEGETETRRKRKRAVTKVLTPVMGLCLVAMLGVGIWQSGILGRYNAPIPRDTSSQDPTSSADPTDDTEYAVYTDSVHLPENNSGIAVDMMAVWFIKARFTPNLRTFTSMTQRQPRSWWGNM